MIGVFVSLILLIQGIPVTQGGTVTGVLRDSQGNPLPGVRMAAVAHASSIEETITAAAMAGLAETDEQGRFTLENIPPGRYSIAAGRLDLQTYYPGTQNLAVAEVLTIAAGTTISGINFVLSDSSLGRGQGGPAQPNFTAMIPVRVIVENGEKLPISAGGKLIAIRLESGASFWTIPITGSSFTVSGPVTADFRVLLENLPDSFEVKSAAYGSTDITKGSFRLTNANFPTLSWSRSTVASPSPPPVNENDLLSRLEAARARAQEIASSTSLSPALTPPSSVSITIGRAPRTSSGGVRVSGWAANTDKRSFLISGRTGVVFSDESFEFDRVPPGRHLVAAVNTEIPKAAVIVVGDKDVNGIELKPTFLLPMDVRVPRDPLPPGSYSAGTSLPMARLTGTVLDEETRKRITEGDIEVRLGDYSRRVPIDTNGHFETFYLLPGTYGLRFQIFGHSTIGPAVTVEDKEIDMELTVRRLY